MPFACARHQSYFAGDLLYSSYGSQHHAHTVLGTSALCRYIWMVFFFIYGFSIVWVVGVNGPIFSEIVSRAQSFAFVSHHSHSFERFFGDATGSRQAQNLHFQSGSGV
jgi:hypothetical protein